MLKNFRNFETVHVDTPCLSILFPQTPKNGQTSDKTIPALQIACKGPLYIFCTEDTTLVSNYDGASIQTVQKHICKYWPPVAKIEALPDEQHIPRIEWSVHYTQLRAILTVSWQQRVVPKTKAEIRLSPSPSPDHMWGGRITNMQWMSGRRHKGDRLTGMQWKLINGVCSWWRKENNAKWIYIWRFSITWRYICFVGKMWKNSCTLQWGASAGNSTWGQLKNCGIWTQWTQDATGFMSVKLLIPESTATFNWEQLRIPGGSHDMDLAIALVAAVDREFVVPHVVVWGDTEAEVWPGRTLHLSAEGLRRLQLWIQRSPRQHLKWMACVKPSHLVQTDPFETHCLKHDTSETLPYANDTCETHRIPRKGASKFWIQQHLINTKASKNLHVHFSWHRWSKFFTQQLIFLIIQTSPRYEKSMAGEDAHIVAFLHCFMPSPLNCHTLYLQM